MGLFQRFKEPVVLKSSNHIKEEYEFVKELCKSNNNSKLQVKLKQLEYLLKCEENILDKLKNSHMPMYIIHDINLEYLGFKGQIDYIVITKNKVYVIESKELFGNIKIDNQGNFIRSYKLNDNEYKEDIDSPIKKNEKNLDLLKLIGYQNKTMIDKLIFDKEFYRDYQSLIVLGDKNSILDDYDASYDIKDKIVNVDQLINYIKENNKLDRNKFSNKEMLNIAKTILDKHIEPFIYYDLLYKDYLNNNANVKDNDLDIKLEKELKKYRYYLSRKENVLVHNIFNDKVLKELIKNKPLNKEELCKVKGFGKRKVDKYGSKIIEIIKKYDMINI